MTSQRLRLLLNARRRLLRALIPEIYWPTTVLVDNTMIPLRGMPFSFGVKRAILNGTYEAPERELLKTFIQPGMKVVEMGGSLGILTAIIAQGIGPSGRVVSIEAGRELAATAQEWLTRHYSNVTVVHGYGFPSTHLPDGLVVQGFENHGVSLGGQVEFSYEGTGKKGDNTLDQPQSLSLQDIMDQFAMNGMDALVCDIEGSELIMTRPDFSLPKCLRYLLIELHPGLYPDKDIDKNNILTSIQSQGFQLQATHSGSFFLERTQEMELRDSGSGP